MPDDDGPGTRLVGALGDLVDVAATVPPESVPDVLDQTVTDPTSPEHGVGD